MPKASGSGLLSSLGRVWRRLFRRGRIEADFQDQIQLHIAQRASEYAAAGLSPDEARRAALRKFGNVALVTEDIHRESRSSRLEALRKDIGLGFRMFSRSPRFAIAVTLTVSLGVGVNVGVFSALRAVVIGDSPFREARQIIHIWQTGKGIAPQAFGSSDVAALRALPVFDAFGGTEETSTVVVGTAEPEFLNVGAVTEGFFDVFGTRAEQGRALGGSDFNGASQVAVIANSVWATQFGRSPEVIGRSIRVGTELRTVVGVMPASFDEAFPDGFLAKVWTPRVAASESRVLSSFGRVSPGTSFEVVEQIVRDVMRPRQAQLAPISFPGGRSIAIDGTGLQRLGQSDAEAAMPGLLTVQIAAALLLLIASANLANMFLAHTQNRRREIGTRVALGAGRKRVAGQLLTEATVLATIGCVAGLLLASLAATALEAQAGVLPRAANPGVGVPEVLVGLGSAWLMAFLFAGLPAYAVTRIDPIALIRERAGGFKGRPRLAQWLLVATQVMLSVVVLSAAGILIRSFTRVMSEPLGFRPDGLVIAELRFPPSKSADDVRRTLQRTEVGLQERFGRDSWSIGSMPFASGAATQQWSLGGGAFNFEQSIAEESRAVSANYFSTLGIALVRGRTFGDADSATSPPVAVVNQEFVRRHGKGKDLLGASLRTARQDFVIVGIVADVRTSRLTRQPSRAVYTFLDQVPSSRFAVAVKSEDVPHVSSAIAEVARLIGSDVVVTRVETARSRIATTEARRRFYLVLLSAFGALGLALCGIGILGVTSTAMAFRIRDLAVRLALGANPRRVKFGVLRTGLVPVIYGVAAGLVVTWWVGKSIQAMPAVQGQLYETSVRDVPTLVVTSAVLLAVGALASWLPARRADSVNPASVLKGE